MRSGNVAERVLWLAAFVTGVASPAFAAEGESANTATAGESAVASESAAEVRDKPRLLIMNFKALGVEPSAVEAASDITTGAFQEQGRFEVISTADVQSLIDLEADRSVAGCANNSCLAEIAGALGADFVVTGRMSKLGESFVFKLALLDPGASKNIATETFQIGALETLPKAIKPAVSRLTAKAFGEEAPEVDEALRRDLKKTIPKPVAASPQEEGGGLGLTILLSGLGVAGLATSMGMAGALAAAYALSVVWDAKSSGAAKQLARDTVGPLGIIFMLSGFPVAMIANGLIITGFFVE